jgi:hypothetical protein
MRHRLGLLLLAMGRRLLRDGATSVELTNVQR